MGTISNSLFQTLMGWIRALTSDVWATVNSPESATLTRWIGNNWIGLAVGLCVVGLLIDLIVYLFRWQPLRVWASFFRRRRHRHDGEEELTEETESAEDPYAEEEYVHSYPEETYIPEDAPAAPVPVTEAERNPRREPGGEPVREPEFPAEDPRDWAEPVPESMTATFEQAIVPRRRRRVSDLFTEENEKKAAAPEEVIDRYAAYRRPVYPSSWQKEKKEQEEREWS